MRSTRESDRGAFQRRCRRGSATVALALAIGLSACDRGATPQGVPTTQSVDRVPLPAKKPEYRFAEGLAAEHPEVVAFMRHFLETCLVGDYSGYRRLVARATDPESRARFERVLHALRSLKIETIEPIELPGIPPPAYLVVGEAEFELDERAARRRMASPRRVAILVLEEEGELRMALAPPELQPADEEPEPTSMPTTRPTPSYPWDEDGDY